jgi:carboxyl-terminal processing protease
MNDDSHPTRRRRFPLVFLLLATFASGALIERSGLLPGAGRREPPGLGNTFDPFWEAWHLVKAYYVDQERAQDRRMTQGAIAGMLAALGDVGHTGYLTPEDVHRMEERLSGRLQGIGARITLRNRLPTILHTLPGSPARAAGLQPGDIIDRVEDQPVVNLSLAKLVEKVRGPAGSVVRLQVLRKGKPLNFEITRGNVNIPEVAWALLPDSGIAHLAIREFGSKADEQLRAALDESRRRGARGLLVDVRGNPGGLKEQAVAVTSEFLQNGQVVFIQEDSHGRQEKVLATDGGRAGSLPVCVLIDEGTASSAEIFAGALKDHGRARLVGTTTFGTGTVLREFRLSDGSAVLLAVAKWLTPSGHEIWHKGIAPDVQVELPQDATILMPESEEGLTAAELRKSTDKQLLRALDILREQLPPAGKERQ